MLRRGLLASVIYGQPGFVIAKANGCRLYRSGLPVKVFHEEASKGRPSRKDACARSASPVFAGARRRASRPSRLPDLRHLDKGSMEAGRFILSRGVAHGSKGDGKGRPGFPDSSSETLGWVSTVISASEGTPHLFRSSTVDPWPPPRMPAQGRTDNTDCALVTVSSLDC